MVSFRFCNNDCSKLSGWPNCDLLNWKCMMSPSWTTCGLTLASSLQTHQLLPVSPTYVFPSCRYFPAALMGAIDLAPPQRSWKSWYETTSALMKPLSKSPWMAPAACGARQPRGTVQHLISFSPATKIISDEPAESFQGGGGLAYL